MILVDTNVISEIWRPERSLTVQKWLDTQQSGRLFISAITMGELYLGALRIADGRRKTNLLTMISELESGSFAGQILDFDIRCSKAYGRVKFQRERIGRPVLAADAAIAATAITHGLSLATRNIRDFEGLDLKLINPFEGAA
jgi:toxin FitB